MENRLVPSRLRGSDNVHPNGSLFDLQDRSFQRSHQSTYTVVLSRGTFARNDRLYSKVFSSLLRCLQFGPLVAGTIVTSINVLTGTVVIGCIWNAYALFSPMLGGTIFEQQQTLVSGRPSFILNGTHSSMRLPTRVDSRVRLSRRSRDIAVGLSVYLHNRLRYARPLLRLRLSRSTLADTHHEQ